MIRGDVKIIDAMTCMIRGDVKIIDALTCMIRGDVKEHSNNKQ
jgi:hypothetical protein